MVEVKMFDMPQMVAFIDKASNEILSGIGYGDKVICACCGSIFELDKVEVIRFISWVDISETIQEGRVY